ESPAAYTCPRDLLHVIRLLPFERHPMFRPPFANQSKAKRSCSYPFYFAPILRCILRSFSSTLGLRLLAPSKSFVPAVVNGPPLQTSIVSVIVMTGTR